VYSESDRDTHSMVVGALAHSETFSHSSLRTTKSNVNSPATSYGLNIESTCISFPNGRVSSSTILSLSSVPATEAFISEGGETGRELKVVFVLLATSERVFKTTIGGVEREEREISTSLSEMVVYAPTERLVNARPRPLFDGPSGEVLHIPSELSSFRTVGETVTIGIIGWGKLDDTGVKERSFHFSALGVGDDFLGNTLLVSLSGVRDLRCFPGAGVMSATEAALTRSPVVGFE
jgi:hypothetical protein